MSVFIHIQLLQHASPPNLFVKEVRLSVLQFPEFQILLVVFNLHLFLEFLFSPLQPTNYHEIKLSSLFIIYSHCCNVVRSSASIVIISSFYLSTVRLQVARFFFLHLLQEPQFHMCENQEGQVRVFKSVLQNIPSPKDAPCKKDSQGTVQ